MSREEEIRTCLSDMDSETVKDALAMLLAQQTGKNNTTASQQILPGFANFAQAILYLKRKYHFPELNVFTTEADLVYVQAADRRILLTERNRQPEQPIPDVIQPSTQEQAGTNSGSTYDEDMDNAFEPVKKEASRFSHLEL